MRATERRPWGEVAASSCASFARARAPDNAMARGAAKAIALACLLAAAVVQAGEPVGPASSPSVSAAPNEQASRVGVTNAHDAASSVSVPPADPPTESARLLRTTLSELAARCPFAECDRKLQKSLAAGFGRGIKKVTRRELALLIEVRAALSRAEPKSGTPLAKTRDETRKVFPRLLDAELRALVEGRRWDDAASLIAEHEGTLGVRWAARARKETASKAARTTELVAPCTRAPRWGECRAALEVLVSACGDNVVTCNPPSRKAIEKSFVPLFDTDELATDEALLAIAKNVRFLDGLAKSDPLRRLADKATRVVEERVEAAIRASARAGDVLPARSIAAAHEVDFGARWVSRMQATIEAETRLAESARAEESEPSAKVRKACVKSCQRSKVQCERGLFDACDPKKERCCEPAPEDCERYAVLSCKG